MRVLLVAVNRQRSPFPVAPLGALAAAAAARAAGFEVDLLDLMFTRLPALAVRSALKGRRYDVVGLSIRNLDNCLWCRPVSYLQETARVVREVRRHSQAAIVLGGSGFSVAPAGWMRRTGADWGVVGEAETALPALLRDLAAGRSPRQVPGVVAQDADAEGAGPPALAPRPDLAALPWPDHWRCRYGRYLAGGGFVGIQTKRGCPFRCIYCTYPLLEGTTCRLRPPALVADEIESAGRSGPEWRHRHFYFVDGTFNAPREHALGVCGEIIARRLPVQWMACCNPVGLDADLASAMAAAGCIGVELSVDAATEPMLAAMGKPFGPGEIRSSMAALAGAGVPFSVHLLLGGPGQTLADIRQAQEFLDECPRPNAVFATVGIRVYPGTPMEAIARREGLLADRDDLFAPAFYVSPHLGDGAMTEVDRLARRRDHWSTPTDWQRLTMRVIQALCNRWGIRPQWKDVLNYGRYMR